MLDVNISEFKTAFHLHGGNSNRNSDPSDFLLLFYAVECGLKTLILRSRNKTHFSDQKEHLKSHDLFALIRMLNIPFSVIKNIKSDFVLERGGSCKLEEIHQAWRYGVAITPHDENTAVSDLRKLQKEIKGRI